MHTSFKLLCNSVEEESLSDKEETWRALSGIKEIFETAFKFAVESNAPLMII